ncbi:MAG: hypothetical protein AB7Q29_13535 [Vicinamibacterales bacterium]
MASYRYILAPFVWQESDGLAYWAQPPGSVACVDLRRASDQDADAVGQDRAYGFFALPVDASVPSGAVDLGVGDCREIASDAMMRSAWASTTGYEPAGDRLVDLLWDQLTNGADPLGADSCKPLVPTAAGLLELHLGGHSLVRSERFAWGGAYTNRLQALVQADVSAMLDRVASLRGAAAVVGRAAALRALGGLCVKYGLSIDDRDQWQQLIAPARRRDVAGPAKPTTTLSDAFTRADQTGLGTSAAGWSWTELNAGQIDIVSNAAAVTSGIGNSNTHARAGSVLSSADHWAQVTLLNVLGSGSNTTRGVMTRQDGTTSLACYWFDAQDNGASNDVWRTFKRSAVTSGASGYTAIGTNTTLDVTPGDIIRGRSNGSTQTRYHNGSAQNAVTDTTISSALYTGLVCFGVAGLTMDDFLSSDDLGGPFPHFLRRALAGGLALPRGGLI